MRSFFLLAIAVASTVSGQTCPSGSIPYAVTNTTVATPTTDSQCCKMPVSASGDLASTCKMSTRRTSGADYYTVTCTFLSSGTYTIMPGANVASLSIYSRGGDGGSTSAYKGGIPVFWITDMSGYSRTLQRSGPVNVAVWVNEGDNSAIKSEYGAGGGGYSAYGDASCRDANPGAVFPNPTTGAECRWYVSGGGSGASNKFAGVPDNTQGTKGNSVSNIKVASESTSIGALPYVNAAGVMSGGGGGSGAPGSGAPRPGFTDSTDMATGSGSGGRSGPTNVGSGKLTVVNIPPPSSGGKPAQVQFQMVGFADYCFVPATVTTTFTPTESASTTQIVETVYTPATTITESSTSTIVNTPATATVTSTETVEVEAGPDYYPVYVNITTTPLTSTVQVSTDVTTTPETATITQTSMPDVSTVYETAVVMETPASATFTATETAATINPACTTTVVDVTTTPAASTVTATATPSTSTVYQTSVATVTPAVSTYTAVQSVATGTAACTNYRLVYPASCCPNTYVKLTPRSTTTKQRRALTFGKRSQLVGLEKRATITLTVTVTAATQTVTQTFNGTTTLPGGTVTVTSTVTTETEAPTPYATVTETTTQTKPGPQVPYSVTAYDEAETPLVYETSTSTHEAPTPFFTVTETAATPLTTSIVDSTTTVAQGTVTTTSTAYSFLPCETVTSTHQAPTPTQTVTETAATPLSTVTVRSTTTLAQQTTTTTSTAYSQATTCAAKTVYTQSACPLPLLRGVDQLAQITNLNLWKAAATKGGQPLVVDCGTAGMFTY